MVEHHNQRFEILTICDSDPMYGWTAGIPIGVVHITGWFSIAIICVGCQISHDMKNITNL